MRPDLSQIEIAVVLLKVVVLYTKIAVVDEAVGDEEIVGLVTREADIVRCLQPDGEMNAKTEKGYATRCGDVAAEPERRERTPQPQQRGAHEQEVEQAPREESRERHH